MSLQSKPYYWVRCDNCGEDCEYDDFSAFADPGMAFDGAVSADWTEHDGRHHCPDCPPLTRCEDCGAEAGECAADRDDRCPACWAKLEAEAEAEAAAS